MHKYIYTGLLMLAALLAQGQNPVPAPPQKGPVAIVGAKAHLGNGQVVDNAVITFDQGLIRSVTSKDNAPDLKGYEVIDATGKHVYPGFLAANTQLGLVEISSFKATRDHTETGELNPNIRSLIAYNTDSRVIPTVRARGVLTAQVTPDGGMLAGNSSIVQLDAWNWEDAAVLTDDGQHFYWPSRYRFNWSTQTVSKNERYDEEVAAVGRFFEEAKAYCQQSAAKTTNLKFAACCPLFDGSRRLYVHADLARDMEEAVLMAKSFGMTAVIIGGRDSWQIVDFLRDNNVAVVLGRIHSLPTSNDSDIDQPYKTAAALYQAGVRFGISIDGFWQVRNLPFQAGTAVAYGLPYEQGIKAISGGIAEILGVGNRLGTLEAGKAATLFIAAGDILDMRSSVVDAAFIDGRLIDLNNVQRQLYERFQEKYDRQKD